MFTLVGNDTSTMQSHPLLFFRVTHKGKASIAFRRILFIAVIGSGIFGFLLAGVAFLVGRSVNSYGYAGLGFLVLIFALFARHFFRDPDAIVPAGRGLIVAPGHGRVDVIDETEELHFMGGRCRRVSIFLSVFDVHIQQAPVSGRVALVRHTAGQFLNALNLESAALNENVVMGFEPTEPACGRVAIKLITGLIARRIVPWAAVGDVVSKGDRVSLIQFGSRVDIYLPANAEVAVKLGDRVVGGETVVARLK
ncbi:MAG: phosphatidylserine decarboxylase family protein [Pedosphaera sp.]|nr:phosphatidylserine decarboxylase family protein [Pedosphaera sp.]